MYRSVMKSVFIENNSTLPGRKSSIDADIARTMRVSSVPLNKDDQPLMTIEKVKPKASPEIVLPVKKVRAFNNLKLSNIPFQTSKLEKDHLNYHKKTLSEL